VDGRSVREHHLVEFAKPVGDFPAVEIDDEFAFLHIDARHDTEIAVVNFPIVVVFEASLAATSPEA
jgi:hypothetical protein